MEIWKDIPGYEELYAVSSYSRVKSYANDRILKPVVKQNGYSYVSLFKYGKQKEYLIHRLVAAAFIPNPDNLPFVCHKDDDKTNNHPDNLFWGTNKDNMKDCASKNRQRIKKRAVFAHSPNGSMYWYESTAEAARQAAIRQGNLWKCLRGKANTAGGFKWSYAD